MSATQRTRRSADDMAVVVEDLVKLLDGIGSGLRRGRYPDRSHGAKIAAVLRRVADDLVDNATTRAEAETWIAHLLAFLDLSYSADDNAPLALDSAQKKKKDKFREWLTTSRSQQP